jgi:hypothetical protein
MQIPQPLQYLSSINNLGMVSFNPRSFFSHRGHREQRELIKSIVKTLNLGFDIYRLNYIPFASVSFVTSVAILLFLKPVDDFLVGFQPFRLVFIHELSHPELIFLQSFLSFFWRKTHRLGTKFFHHL